MGVVVSHCPQPLPPLCGPGLKICMEARSPCREDNDSLPIQIPRCDTRFVQFKEEKLFQFGYFFFLERNRHFVYYKDFGRRRVT